MQNNYIFIIGVSRTGSKFYMQFLNSHDDIYIAPEMIFRHPFKKDLYSIICKSLKKKDSIDSLIKKIYISNLKDTSVKTINLINKDALLQELTGLTLLSQYSIFKKILELLADLKGKRIYGAKFPVHYSYLNELLDNFPNSKILFLTRDPREIYYSDSVKKRKEIFNNLSKFPVKGIFFLPTVIFYTIYEWNNSLKLFQKLEMVSKSNIKLFKYEDIIVNKEKVAIDISKFLNMPITDFHTNQIKVVDSSFNKLPILNRWKNHLNILEKIIFKLFIGRKMKRYGYK